MYIDLLDHNLPHYALDYLFYKSSMKNSTNVYYIIACKNTLLGIRYTTGLLSSASIYRGKLTDCMAFCNNCC